MSELTMGQKIKYLREKHNLTLEQVGDAVGVGKSTVRKWENGIIANMRRDKIAGLAKALHTTPAYLMGWEESPSGSDEKTADPKAGGGESLEDIIPGYDSLSNENKDRVRDYVAVLLAAQHNQ